MSIERNETERERVKKAMEEISNSMTRIEGERDFIKEAINDICEGYQIDKKVFRKMCRVYHKQNYSEEVAVAEEFATLYELVSGETTLEEN